MAQGRLINKWVAGLIKIIVNHLVFNIENRTDAKYITEILSFKFLQDFEKSITIACKSLTVSKEIVSDKSEPSQIVNTKSFKNYFMSSDRNL